MRMDTLRTWYLLLRVSWRRIVGGSLLVIFVLLFYPWGRTPAERVAAGRSYFEGLAVRADDPVLWKRIAVGGFAFAVVQALFILFGYSFLVSRDKRSGPKD